MIPVAAMRVGRDSRQVGKKENVWLRASKALLVDREIKIESFPCDRKEYYFNALRDHLKYKSYSYLMKTDWLSWQTPTLDHYPVSYHLV